MKSACYKSLRLAWLTGLVAGVAVAMNLNSAQAQFQFWQIKELYTDSSGTLQFIELFTPSLNQGLVGGQQIQISNMDGTVTHTFTIPAGNLPGSTVNHSLLFGTAGIQTSGGPAPDYIIPNDFLFAAGGTINFFGANSGPYTVLPTDGFLSRDWSGAIQLNSPRNYAGQTGTVIPAVPEITSPPQSQTVSLDSHAMFCVTVTGSGPLYCQWQFNSTNISGATASCYTRANVQFADAGDYTVVVTNIFGSVTSVVATLSVTPLRIGWFTLDGGGGLSTGAVFAVRGSIGQHDARRLTNGTSVINGGFWGILAVQTSGAPLLSITRTITNTVAVFWPSPSTGFVLQQNTNDVSSVNWSNVTATPFDDGTTKTVIVDPSAGNHFYRLIKP